MGTKVMNRWLVVVGALLIQLCLGAIYAWSVFTPELNKAVADGGFGFSATQTQVVFAVGLAMFAIVMVLAGRWQAKSEMVRRHLVPSTPHVHTSRGKATGCTRGRWVIRAFRESWRVLLPWCDAATVTLSDIGVAGGVGWDRIGNAIR